MRSRRHNARKVIQLSDSSDDDMDIETQTMSHSHDSAEELIESEDIHDDNQDEDDEPLVARNSVVQASRRRLRDRGNARPDYTAIKILHEAETVTTKRRRTSRHSDDFEDDSAARHTRNSRRSSRSSQHDDHGNDNEAEMSATSAYCSGTRSSIRMHTKTIDYPGAVWDARISKAMRDDVVTKRGKARREERKEAEQQYRENDQMQEDEVKNNESADEWAVNGGDDSTLILIDDDEDISEDDAAVNDTSMADSESSVSASSLSPSPPPDPKTLLFRQIAATIEDLPQSFHGVRHRTVDDEEVQELFVKWHERGHIHNTWIDRRVLDQMPQLHIKGMITRFMKKAALEGTITTAAALHHSKGKADWHAAQDFHPEWRQVHRVIGRRRQRGENQFLVKWEQTDYKESTWELAKDIDDGEIARYYKFAEPVPPPPSAPKLSRGQNCCHKRVEELVFNQGRKLRDYQLEGVKWLCFNITNNRPSLLADEMGLGKTCQSIAVCRYLEQFMHDRGPFLIVAPLATTRQWQREFEAWTQMNAVIFQGDADSREIIKQYEFHSFERNGKPMTNRSIFRFNALIVPDSICRMEASFLQQIRWSLMIVDEGHRLKNKQAQISSILGRFDAKHRILLSGTPIQNNLIELWSVLNFLDSATFTDIDDFLARHGQLSDSDKLEELQSEIAPYFLRRMKEDVEKELPPRDELVMEVPITAVQRHYYKMLYTRDFGALLRQKKSDFPSLNNLCMQLRKCCLHPWLLNGVEDEEVALKGLSYSRDSDQPAILKLMVDSSGKLQFLGKLLPKLKEGGHRVLLFSQFTMMLDIVENACEYWEFPYERIDGNITGTERQASIDRFSAADSDRFIFLLSTKAGGLGLNLQAADTIIIFDSDWNPQNDLQAIARSHRIGQTQQVKVFRLVSKDTYEQAMFDRASIKLGLGEAVMGSMKSDKTKYSQSEEKATSKADLELMLRKGFYHFAEDETKEVTDLDFDQIMNSSKVINMGARANDDDSEKKEGDACTTSTFRGTNRFAKASYVIKDDDETINDEDYWRKMLPTNTAAAMDTDSGWVDGIVTGKRRRNLITGSYRENGKRNTTVVIDAANDEDFKIDSDDASQFTDGNDGDNVDPLVQLSARHNPLNDWVIFKDLFDESILTFGYGAWSRIRARMLEQFTRVPGHDHGSVSLLANLTDHNLRAFGVGWLKMMLFHSKSKLAFVMKQREIDEDVRTGRGQRRRTGFHETFFQRKRIGTHDGYGDEASVTLWHCKQLADDARAVIEEEKSIVKQRAQAATLPNTIDTDCSSATTAASPATVSAPALATGAKPEMLSVPDTDFESLDPSIPPYEERHFLDLFDDVPVPVTLAKPNLALKSKSERTKLQVLLSDIERLHIVNTLVAVNTNAGTATVPPASTVTDRSDRVAREKVFPWFDDNDDCELIKGIYLHGPDWQTIRHSDRLTFNARIGTTKVIEKSIVVEDKDATSKMKVRYDKVTENMVISWPDDKKVKSYYGRLVTRVRRWLVKQVKSKKLHQRASMVVLDDENQPQLSPMKPVLDIPRSGRANPQPPPADQSPMKQIMLDTMLRVDKSLLSSDSGDDLLVNQSRSRRHKDIQKQKQRTHSHDPSPTVLSKSETLVHGSGDAGDEHSRRRQHRQEQRLKARQEYVSNEVEFDFDVDNSTEPSQFGDLRSQYTTMPRVRMSDYLSEITSVPNHAKPASSSPTSSATVKSTDGKPMSSESSKAKRAPPLSLFTNNLAKSSPLQSQPTRPTPMQPLTSISAANRQLDSPSMSKPKKKLLELDARQRTMEGFFSSRSQSLHPLLQSTAMSSLIPVTADDLNFDTENEPRSSVPPAVSNANTVATTNNSTTAATAVAPSPKPSPSRLSYIYVPYKPAPPLSPLTARNIVLDAYQGDDVVDVPNSRRPRVSKPRPVGKRWDVDDEDCIVID